MKVILTQNIKGLGRIGDIKNVSDGHARNFLIPNRLAKPATESASKEIEALKVKAEIVSKLEEKEAREVVEKLNGVSITITKKANQTGKLFSSVTKDEVIKELANNGIRVNRDDLSFGEHGEHIKMVGEHIISFEPMAGISQTFTLNIVSE